MDKNPVAFLREALGNFLTAYANSFLFLFYFFSVSSLFRTLFYPWKNIVTTKADKGFSFSEWFNRFSFNVISSGLGFIMRSSLIIFYFLLLIVLILLFPVFLCFYFLFLPILYFTAHTARQEEENKKRIINRFVSGHLTDENNRLLVEKWGMVFYEKYYLTSQWWARPNLFSVPPLARDWAVGYTPILDKYADELTTPSYQTKIQNVVDRQKEINEIERTLTKQQEANVVIVGEEGVGKHTIVDALAKKIYEGKTISVLMYKRILKLNMEKILAEFNDLKTREQFFEGLLNEALKAGNIIFFFDDFDQYISAGSSRVDLTVSIEKFARGAGVQFIGITSPFAYQRYIFENEKIARLFTKVDVFEISKKEAEEILMHNAFNYEKKYRLLIPYEIIAEIVEKSDYYLTSIPFPEKAVDLLDRACILASQLHSVRVSPDIVSQVVTEKSHTPTALSGDLKKQLATLATHLNERIIGQDNALAKIVPTLQRSLVLMGKRKRPLATFLFLGPTGVGKTETAKAIASSLFGNETSLIRFDMSLFQTEQDIVRLIGASDSGYPGLLTKAIRDNPYGVLLLDEIEKANKNLLNIFLTILDEGYFSDGFGKRVDCKNLIIVATSNAGGDKIFRDADSFSSEKKLLDYLIGNKYFSPEFLNRFDGIIAYQPLTFAATERIARKLEAKIISEQMPTAKGTVPLSPEQLRDIIQQAYDVRFGVRDLERRLRENVEKQISSSL
ncbi:ATP-dependent Clp protease ATP-binding subunit [Candidatus Roizmanbacteria bacterium]|nr:ATP-dependent Clp protease ATP-binding subunit [Candidatus Roizmanbacteria bacterium]